MDEQKTMMFSFGEDKPKADVVIRQAAAAMREKEAELREELDMPRKA